MTLAVNVVDRRTPSKEMHRQLQPENTKVRPLILVAYIATEDILPALHN